MLIIGAKGFAKEVLEIFHQQNKLDNIFFYDDVTNDIGDKLYNFHILKSEKDVATLFKNDNRFTIGIGNPVTRAILYEKFLQLGGKFISTISPFAVIGNYGNVIEEGCNIMTGTIITNDVSIKRGCLINLNSTVGHDTTIGEFTELSPGVSISGNCIIGSFCNIGTNATILPKVVLGNNVIVGAGAVVVKDVADGETVVGIPAKSISKK
ncbi:MAG: NeuD/PglB/VioB family sugar acetyltransferase [Ferruginibacter sp.]|nr:NeuD/PglB/VioB family sugar acetyltransferase [Ferruginibacter sp.]